MGCAQKSVSPNTSHDVMSVDCYAYCILLTPIFLHKVKECTDKQLTLMKYNKTMSLHNYKYRCSKRCMLYMMLGELKEAFQNEHFTILHSIVALAGMPSASSTSRREKRLHIIVCRSHWRSQAQRS
jgi:hypothetical protein